MGVFAMLLFFHERGRHVACIKKTNCINIKILIPWLPDPLRRLNK